ncbi:MAG: GntR family transcriptional regulator [Herminiimonas sp.]|nr:GntR family transcriptional regulator [Herminiimonas sp.]
MNTSSSSDLSQSEERRIVRKTAVELVVEKLRNRILNGKLAPGSQLRQESLAEELGVSRIPLREAFRLLSSEGLVELQPHRGAFVSLVSAEEVEELFELRQKIEPWLVEEAAAKISEDVLKQAARLVVEMDKVKPERWGFLNWQLHEILYSAAEKPTALAMVKTLHDKSERYFRFQIVNAPIRKQSRTEHLELIKACRERKGSVAREVMQHHIQDAAVQILAIVRQLMDESETTTSTRKVVVTA